MTYRDQYFIFRIESQRYAIQLQFVEKVIRTVELIPVPDDTGRLLGLVNLRGRIIPVLNIRKQFRLPEKETDIYDRIIIFKATDRICAFIVEEVEGIADFSGDNIELSRDMLPYMENYIKGVGKYEGKTALIINIQNMQSHISQPPTVS